MNAGELIAELQRVDPQAPVRLIIGYYQYEAREVVGNSDHVLIGETVPPECHERDYKNED